MQVLYLGRSIRNQRDKFICQLTQLSKMCHRERSVDICQLCMLQYGSVFERVVVLGRREVPLEALNAGVLPKGSKTNNQESDGILLKLSLPAQYIEIMAIARPVRVLGLLALGLWVFFIYQVWGPTKVAKGPGDTLKNMDRDPNLDCMYIPNGHFAKTDW